MKKFFKIMIWIVVAGIFAATIYFLYRNSQPEEPVYELVSPMDGNSIERRIVLTGKIEPRDEISVKPQISGIISEILVNPGDRVAEGDIVARIKVIPDAAQLSSAQNRVELARIALDDATLKHERAAMLYDRKLISREEMENASTTLERAKSELSAARDAFDIVKDGISKSDASGSNTNVRATINGIVLDVPVKVGSSVIQANTFNDGTTVATIADMTKLIFKGKADETEVGNLRAGMPMTVTVGALPGVEISSAVEYIAPKGVEQNGANTFEVKGAVEGDSISGLRSGFSANASISLSDGKVGMTVPESVVEFSGDSTFVYLLTDSVSGQKFARTQIVTGISDGINIEVKSGIESSARLRGKQIRK